MISVNGKNGLQWFVCVILLLGASLAPGQQSQGQSSDTPTVDLESQPNTANYPSRTRRRWIPPADANAQPANSDGANSQPEKQEPPRPQPQPQTQVAAPQARTNSPAPNPPAVRSTRPRFIGPPAPLPPTPEQMPPMPPKITYQDGLLSVESVNARLTDVLNAIHTQTGIQFEGVQSTADKVAGKFGPAAPDQVLTSLLQGSHFDYVIVGKLDDPGMVERVILNPSAGSPSAPPVAQAQRANAGEDEDSDDEATPEGAQPNQPPASAAAPKTPEQLLEELKRIQEQQAQQQNPQQNQQEQPPATRPPNRQ